MNRRFLMIALLVTISLLAGCDKLSSSFEIARAGNQTFLLNKSIVNRSSSMERRSHAFGPSTLFQLTAFKRSAGRSASCSVKKRSSS